MGITVTKDAAKLILMTLIEEDVDPSSVALSVNLDRKTNAIVISFEQGLYNLKNFHGLNVVMNDLFRNLVIDVHKVNDRIGLIFTDKE